MFSTWQLAIGFHAALMYRKSEPCLFTSSSLYEMPHFLLSLRRLHRTYHVLRLLGDLPQSCSRNIVHTVKSKQSYHCIMDTCMRNLSFVHHIASLSPLETRPDLDDTGRCKVGLQAEASKENVLCPKPCRMALSFCTPEIVKPFLQFQSCSRVLECEPGYEILEIFGKGAICRDGEVVSLGCSPPYCSPPVRSTNPIVHDKQFCNQKSCSLMPTRPKIVSKPSFPLSPVVRVEGFECANRDAHLDVNMHHPN